jgi:hypothetical protein
LVVYADGRYQLTGEGWDSIDENLGAIYLDGFPRLIEFCDQDVAHIRAWLRQQQLPAPPPLPPEIPQPVESEEQALEQFVRTYPRRAKRETYADWEAGRLVAANNNPALKGMRITQTMLREASRRIRKKSATVP